MSDGPRLAGLRTDLTPGVRPAAGSVLGRARQLAVRVGPPLGFLSVILLWTAAYLGRALRSAAEFTGFEGDGPFQLFNPLRRIAAGQVGGVDFQYFHGLALPYLHYPIYALCGGDMYAAEFSRHLLQFVVYLVGMLAVCFAVTRRLTPTLGLAAVGLVLTEQADLWSLTLAGNSPLGVRSAVPVFVLAVLLAQLRPRIEAVAVGLVAGVGVLIGVEHGTATLGMIGAVWLGRRLTGCPGGTLDWAAGAAASFLVTAGSILLAIGGTAGAAAALRFAYVEMPHDQFWYFGTPPNPFLFSWTDVLTDRTLLLRVVVPVVLLGALIVRRARLDPTARPEAVVLIGMLAYGTLATAAYFGYCSKHYLEPPARAALMVGVVLGWRAWAGLEARGPDAEPLRRRVRWALAGGVALVLLIGPSIYDKSSVLTVASTAREIASGTKALRDGTCAMIPKIRAELDEITAAIDADRAANGVTRLPVIWSTYAGRVEDHYGVFHPYADYAIHALGPHRRAEYLAALRRSNPDYAITCRPGAFGYEEWLRNCTWEVYEELVLNYDVLLAGTRHAVWRRRPGPWREVDPAAGRVTRDPEGPDWFTVPAPPGFPPDVPRVIEVEYEVRNRLAGVPVVGQLPRYLLGPTGVEGWTPVTLPPYRTTWSFGVIPLPGQTPTYFAKTFSLVGGSFAVKKVHVRPLPLTPAQREVLVR